MDDMAHCTGALWPKNLTVVRLQAQWRNKRSKYLIFQTVAGRNFKFKLEFKFEKT
jgi:hypothetical protein